jgi:hypothetical protein
VDKGSATPAQLVPAPPQGLGFLPFYDLDDPGPSLLRIGLCPVHPPHPPLGSFVPTWAKSKTFVFFKVLTFTCPMVQYESLAGRPLALLF